MAQKPKKPNRYADAPYAVGKGKPPVDTQFKGCGNRKGRPKKPSLHVEIKTGMQRLVEEPVTVRTAEGERQVPAVVAMAMKVRNKVIESGSTRQFRDFLSIVREFDALTPERDEEIRGVLVVPGRSASAEEWERDYGHAARGFPPALGPDLMPGPTKLDQPAAETKASTVVTKAAPEVQRPSLPGPPPVFAPRHPQKERPPRQVHQSEPVADIRDFLEKHRKRTTQKSG